MAPFIVLLERLDSAAIGALFVGIAARTAVLLVLLLALTAAFRRASAGLRHLLWTGGLAAALVLVPLLALAPVRLEVLPTGLTTPVMSAVRGAVGAAGVDVLPPARPDRGAGVEAAAVIGAGAEAAAVTGAGAGEAAAISTGAVLPSTGEAGARPSLAGRLAWLLWGIPAALLLGRLLVGARRLRSLVAEAAPVGGAWTGLLYESADRLDLAAAPRLVRSDRASLPFTCGLLRPTIVLPPYAEGWPEERRRAVLVHELAHIRRRDLLGHLVSRAACALHWYNPLVWLAARRLRAESERACDDLVLSAGARASEYAAHLLQIVTRARRSGAPAVALPMAQRREFEGRMLAILDPGLRRAAPGRPLAAGLAAGVAALAVLVAAAAPLPDPALAAPLPTAERPGEGLQAPDAPPAASAVDPGAPPAPPATPATAAVPAPLAADPDQPQGSGEEPADAEPEPSGAAAPAPPAQEGARPATVDLLIDRLTRDPVADVRLSAAWALGSSGGAGAVAALDRALRSDPSAGVREMAAWALAQLRQPGGAAALLAAAESDRHPGVRATAVWALAEMRVRAAVPVMERALGDPDPEVRTLAAWGLAHLPATGPRPALIRLLSDRDPEVRMTAAWSLGTARITEAVPALTTALRDETDPDARLATLWALLRMGDAVPRAVYEEALEHPDPEVRGKAAAALVGGGDWPWPWPWPQPRPFPASPL